MHGFELVGVNGGVVVRFAGAGGEGGLGVGEQGAHEHRESVRRLLGQLSCTVSLWVGRSVVSPSSPAAARKGNGVGRGIGFDSTRVELNWKVEKLLRWLDGTM